MGAPPDEPRGWQVRIKDPRDNRKDSGGGLSEGQSMSTSGSYEKFFRAEGQDMRPYHGSSDRISGAGKCFGFGDLAAHDRQRGVGEALLY